MHLLAFPQAFFSRRERATPVLVRFFLEVMIFEVHSETCLRGSGNHDGVGMGVGWALHELVLVVFRSHDELDARPVGRARAVQLQTLKGGEEIGGESSCVGRLFFNGLPAFGRRARRRDEEVLGRVRDGEMIDLVIHVGVNAMIQTERS